MSSRTPVIQIAPGASAPVLSYSVPEPTSYSGRNFIDLALPDAYFRDDIPYEPNVPTQAETLARVEAIQASARSVLARSGVLAAGATESSLTLPGGERVSADLARLDRDEVEAMRAAGKELVLFRGLSGALRHRWIPSAGRARRGASRAKPLAADAAMMATAFVTIGSPSNGASFRGPHTGVEVTFTGQARTSSLGANVGAELKVGSGPWRWLDSGSMIVNWSHTEVVRTSGPVVVQARATDTRGSTATESITIHVTLDPPPDSTAPVVSFDSPADGAVVVGTESGTTLQVKVNAGDPETGIQGVRVSRSGSSTWHTATLDAGTGKWGCPLALPVGTFTLRAEATNKAGLKSEASVGVTVLPPDATPPTVTIQSPASGRDIAGPFEGVDVVVSGTAGDDRGVTRVILRVDGNPEAFAAAPGAPGDWSTWSGTVRISSPGTRIITAHCTDTAGHESEAQVAVNVILVPEMVSRLNRIILVESHRLSSYLGNYGAGRTLKTFSLLPGEKTKLSIKTFTKTETDAKNASSILDSYSDESSSDFEDSVGMEQANKANYDESSKYSFQADASASWGWGSAAVKGDTSSGTNRAREEFIKNVSNATQKHVSKASARRDVQVNTSYEVKETSGEETAVEREIENVNVSRTLNFVFRQMNQEFITLLHLVDVRLGFFKVVDVEGREEPEYVYREFTLPEVDTLLAETVVPEKRDEVRASIVRQLSSIVNYREEVESFVEWREIPDEGPDSRYLRARKDRVSVYPTTPGEPGGQEIRVPGIILAANQHVLRTEGILVDAVLGDGDALDGYSHGLQDEAVEAKRLANEAARQLLERNRLAMQIVSSRDAEAARIFAQLFPAFPPAADEAAPASLATVESGDARR